MSVPPTGQAPGHRVVEGLRGWGRRITEPHPDIKEEELRREATRAAALTLLFVVFILAVITTIPFILDPGTPPLRAPIFLGGSLAALLYIPAYLLARSRHPRAGATLLVWGALPAVYLLVESGHGTMWERGALNYLLFPSMLASLLLPIRHVLAVWVAAFAFAAWHGPPASDPDFGEFTNTLILLGVFPPLLSLGAYLREQQLRTIGEQADRLNAVLDAAPEAMIAVDREGRIRVANSRAADLFGYTHDELLGRLVDELVPDARRARHTAERIPYQEHPSPRHFGDRMGLEALRKDGSVVPVEISLSPVRGGKQVVASIVDISGRLATQTELATFRSLMDQAADSLLIMDRDALKFRYTNQTAQAMFGYSAEEFQTLSVDRLQEGEPSMPLVQQRLGQLQDQSMLAYESRFKRKDGTTFAAEVGARLVSLGTSRFVVAGMRDITQRKKREQEMQAAREAAEAGMKAKDTFLATMSHELRTPLNGVLGMAQLMGLGDLTPEQREQLAIIEESANDLLRLLQDILDFTGLQAGTLPIAFAPVVLDAAVAQEVESHQAEARAKGLRLTFSGPPAGQARPVITDGAHARHAARLLLSNALKFTERGEVRVLYDERPDGVSIAVQDDGPGMAPEQLTSLFGPFQQLEGGLTRRHGGAGLGLALARRLATALGGTITATSAEGRGSTFTLVLPRDATGRPISAAASS